ncbi:hypothetical protein [Photobacterium leiognathi]|uniref:hypothetical protein n=1 Tax=Photobacterium leiognathi TaxID=553611 RepID=UPI00020882CF|nr:hypothetical protein [Photobacterium leiognathi]PSV02743.1 hypothetical protein C0W80_07065 [Photobacterium leiognathi subsp. mandapamensis]PSW45076.1 hypothetical protein C0W40_06420 [Photobacterium leiognathi subsp. mandapamensis]PSW53901.1 hypothetical protein CTM83_08925 [Photobacterium leiognathi subsp. mandapamensis]GAA04527.1 putative uncharacterized protein [Photobacterium leiognathi subsp. mandapamensis svers.1.1.]
MFSKRDKYALILSTLILVGCNGSSSDSTTTTPTEPPIDPPIEEPVEKDKTFTSVDSFDKYIAENGEIKADQTITLELADGEAYVLNKDLTVKGNLIIK